MTTIAEYLDGLPAAERAALAGVCAAVRSVVPDAEEGTSYGMPAYRYRGRPLLGVRAAKRHLSIFPFSPAAVDAVRDRLDGFDLAKGTVRFTPSAPLPEDVVADIVRARVAEIDA